MLCKALWNEDVLRIGDALSEQYLGRLESEGLLELARAREHRGEVGGAGRDESDRHFAYQFSNSAARAVYICIDPLDALEDVPSLIRQFFSDGRVLLVEVPCGAGAGALGLLSAIYEQRLAGLLPTTPLYVDILGGDISLRASEHFGSLVDRISCKLKRQSIDATFCTQIWDATDIRSSSNFIDTAVKLSGECDQVILLVSNFSDALNDENIKEQFQHFLSQFMGRIAEPHSVCWIEPTSNKSERILSLFGFTLLRLARWLRISGKSLVSGARYRFFDPVTSCEMHSGVRVLKADRRGLP